MVAGTWQLLRQQRLLLECYQDEVKYLVTHCRHMNQITSSNRKCTSIRILAVFHSIGSKIASFPGALGNWGEERLVSTVHACASSSVTFSV